MTQRLVVIGNGMAGARTVEEILARNGDFTVTMFGDEPYGNYNRIMLSNLLAGVETEEGIFLNDLSWYQENGITLNAGVKIARIDKDSKIVIAEDGSATPYDKLIIATGSYSWTPPMKNVHNPKRGYHQGVFAFRTLDDTRGMIRYARDHERAVVIGGGLLGLEAARGLQNHVSHVTLLHAMGHLMERQLDPKAGAMLQASVEGKLGIEVVTNAMTTEILGKDRVTGVKLADGRVIDCDVVVIAAGIRPNTEMVANSGLPVERGIVVDDQMRVEGEQDIYSVGECAQHRGNLYGLVAPLWDQAKVLADHITGTTEVAYTGSKLHTKLKVAGIDVASMGLIAPEHDTDEVVVYNEPKKGVYKQLIIRDDVLVGAVLVGDNSKAASLIQAFDRGTPLPEERAGLIFDLGGAVEESAEDMPDDAQVCNCNGVSKGAICGAVADGCKTVSGVMDKTRAGKGCGTCKPLVQRIVEWANGGAAEEDPAASWYVPGVPMPKPELMAAIRKYELKSVSSVFDTLVPGAQHDAKSKMGLASLLKMMWADEYVDERDARFINDRVHGNIQRDGTFSVVPQMKGGVTTPAQLRKIAEVAEKYDVPMVKLTGGQRIDLLGVPKEKLPAMWADLDMPSGYAYAKSFRTVKTCVGSDFCRFGVGDSTALGIALEERYQGLEGPGKMKLAVTGCPRNCAEAYVKDLGVVAIDGGRWEIYVGGAAGAHIRKGDLLTTVDSPEEVIRLTGRFLQYYRENANWLERTYSFVPRIGVDRIREIVVEDSDGIAAALDAAVEEAVQAYKDPWKERAEPATPGQFRTSLPLTVLPQVPVRS
ncbi:putative nitrite reductase large subunit [Actinoplanes missouriensis 431]|uniref:assimilatory sulfite reductase (ferredoxin) n=1 Tax=Actinoplanes missouriensis (strain ATCC 14538 / DSM 43046 / CBS 188.64 / JCM 3121 / NBRC 102363 / NCIMB 12654 / NRRL B-3342 / UNCC 431) TaxID=512565 RepID=I0H7T3_ACTM4|nr:nitrite reductase large subunit NirB [Actinoplanes missouriensis]BAL89070.1 putative nitrite reductase large subunit [Actinoplanes missouriensis 431]